MCLPVLLFVLLMCCSATIPEFVGFEKVFYLSLYIWSILSNIISIIYTAKLIEGTGSRIKNIILANVFFPTVIILFSIIITWIMDGIEILK